MTCREVVELFLERSLRLDPELHAFRTIVEDRALNEADDADRAIERGENIGVLHGIPIAVKDLEWTEGIRTTMGSLVYRDDVPASDSIAVERLRESGAIVIGKTNTCEFGMQLESTNRLGPDTRNPWDTSKSSGGSSGGSAAAIAAGFAPLATGSDSAGSIGNPSALCGVVGIKPTHGRIPLWPDPEDSHIMLDTGCIARTVEDCALMLGVMAGEDSRDPVSIRGPAPVYRGENWRNLEKLRIGISTTFSGYPVDQEVRKLIGETAEVFKALGHDLVEAEPKTHKPVYDIYMPLFLGDVHTAFDHLLSQRPMELDPVTVRTLEDARRVTLSEYVQALHRLAIFRRRIDEYFDQYDLLITPNNPVPAFDALNPPSHIDGLPVTQDWMPHLAFLAPWNLAGNPWITVPAGRSKNDLPIGALLVAAKGREDLLFAAAAALETEKPWINHASPFAPND
ncbi:MAG: amidase [Thermoleophilia bacterium]|nr:amidase [Thermoleophilia bacterium]